MARSLYVVCYDISSSRRLKAALLITRRYASGGQKSVHECWLNQAEAGDLLATLQQLINPASDRIMMVRLDPARRCKPRCCAVMPCDDDYLLFE